MAAKSAGQALNFGLPQNPYLAAAGYGVSGAGSILSGIQEADALGTEAQFQASQLRRNAGQILQEGEVQTELYGRRVREILGQQRLGFAASGTSVDVGTPVVLAEQTREIGQSQQMAIELTAWRQAMGLKSQANLVEMSARNRGRGAAMKGIFSGLGDFYTGASFIPGV